MTRHFYTSVGERDYDVTLSISYDHKYDEWDMEIEHPKRIAKADREQIIINAQQELDWDEIHRDYFNDLEESIGCDRYHSERDDL